MNLIFFFRLLSIFGILAVGAPTCQFHLAGFCEAAGWDQRTAEEKQTM